jgi:hypothetical protein
MFPADSLAQQAFADGLRLPDSPPIDVPSALETLRRTGVFSDDPEANFPRAYLVRWLKNAGITVADRDLLLGCAHLTSQTSQLFASYMVEIDFSARRVRGHAKAGAAPALRKALADLASGARDLTITLKQIRGEILNRKVRDSRSNELEQIHAALHEAVFQGQNMRQRMHSFPSSFSPPEDFDQRFEVGSDCTVAPTWLEDSLEELANEAQAQLDANIGLDLQPIRPIAEPAREKFVRASEAVWEVYANSSVTLLDAGSRLPDQLSPFERFHHQLCGHVAALLVRSWKLQWDAASAEQRATLKKAASDMGLAPVPSASSLRRALRLRPAPAARGYDRSVT